MEDITPSAPVGDSSSVPAGTIRDLLKVAFPVGTDHGAVTLVAANTSAEERRRSRVFECPTFPPDLFGFSGRLLQWSGAYPAFCPAGTEFGPKNQVIPIADSDHAAAVEAGREWSLADRNSDDDDADESERNARIAPPSKVIEWWNELLSHEHRPIYSPTSGDREFPIWWKYAYLLMIAADEACCGVGKYDPSNYEPMNISWVDEILRSTQGKEEESAKTGTGDSEPIHLSPRFPSLCVALSRDFVCVQPKSKTPSVGCTPRVLSHHLALLPTQGQIRVHWVRPPNAHYDNADAHDFNVLLVPYPFKIDPAAFQPHHTDGETRVWDWFHIKQSWLPEPAKYKAFISAIDELISNAVKGGKVNAVVFPEYSLNWDLFKELADHICKKYPSISFLTAGASSNCHWQAGNFVLTANFYQIDAATRSYTATSRPKHHRWCLNKSQLETYGLEGTLTHSETWWERIALPERELHVNIFRGGNTFSTLICEDLARSEPAHDVLRSLGPNLVFVLLMDGPQLSFRWPARYSTGLSDDPGSAVLTLTSKALVDMSERIREKEFNDLNKKKIAKGEVRKYQRNRSVALWKDATGSPEPISCQDNASGVLVRLVADRESEWSMDGREMKNCWSWTLADISGRKFSNVVVSAASRKILQKR